MVSNLRIHATIATRLTLPFARSRSQNRLIAVLCRMAERAAILKYRAHFLAAGVTPVNPDWWKHADTEDRENALATEGGKYEMLTGTAGPSLHEKMIHAINVKGSGAYQAAAAALSNKYYTTPLGLPGDFCANGRC